MAKNFQAAAVVAAALCLASLLSIAHCSDHFFVEGKVYCDTCRVQFETKLSEYMPGARVRLECKDRKVGQVKYTVEGETDATGSYKLPVEGEHEEEICEIKLLKSSNPDCSELMQGRDRARVLLTKKNGVSTADRFANSLGFMKKEALPNCADVLRALGFSSYCLREKKTKRKWAFG
ncbi:hypothetical protein L1049_000559 [Liquidambar formosana]|uniref:Uncharacterized protein n=1 Tax=Liquidambar formosana TaxID=63359 RepID=A0AAP0N976_LIQFO